MPIFAHLLPKNWEMGMDKDEVAPTPISFQLINYRIRSVLNKYCFKMGMDMNGAAPRLMKPQHQRY